MIKLYNMWFVLSSRQAHGSLVFRSTQKVNSWQLAWIMMIKMVKSWDMLSWCTNLGPQNQTLYNPLKSQIPIYRTNVWDFGIQRFWIASWCLHQKPLCKCCKRCWEGRDESDKCTTCKLWDLLTDTGFWSSWNYPLGLSCCQKAIIYTSRPVCELDSENLNSIDVDIGGTTLHL